MRRERGFSLLELSLVLALIGLLTTLILPRLDVLTGAEIDSVTRRVANRVRYLREDAARRGIWVRLVLDSETQSLTSEQSIRTEAGWSFAPGEGPLYRPIGIPDSLTMTMYGPGVRTTTEGNSSMVFAADGFADPGSIQVTDDSGRTVSVWIEPARPTSSDSRRSRCPLKGNTTREKGFTLLEVLVALVIIATAFTALLGLHVRNLEMIAREDAYSRALLLAETLVADTELEGYPDLGVTRGDFAATRGDGTPAFRWEREVREWMLPGTREVTIRVIPARGDDSASKLTLFVSRNVR